MNQKKILSGVVIWSIGLAIPMLYHAVLMHAAVQEDGHIYSYHAMVKYFFDLPWIVWPYLVATNLVGICLVISGLKKHPTN
jgi:hypothetical protein